MSDSVDRILDIIDVGLQRSSSGGNMLPGEVNYCVRCRTKDKPEGADFCGGCRAYVLGDSDVDPKEEKFQGRTPFQWSSPELYDFFIRHDPEMVAELDPDSNPLYVDIPPCAVSTETESSPYRSDP